MKKICIFTSTRADYGLLYWLMKAINEDDAFDLRLVVTGTHLSYEHGYTLTHIEEDGFVPAIKIPNLVSDDSSLSLTYSSVLLMQSLASFFEREAPDCFVVLGDRVELLAACNAALLAKIPIVHIHGGEVTEGAMDEKVRHAISKLADLHFTSTDEYRRRVIQMGEAPNAVINCGALGLESMGVANLPSRIELSEEFKFDLNGEYFLVVYHPETNKVSEDVSVLLDVLDTYPEYKKVIIYPNSDLMSRGVIIEIENYKKRCPDNVLLVRSTARNYYFGLMKNCTLYLGNSSSGIIEMPSFYKAIINIGDRQKGRIRSKSTIDVKLNFDCLSAAIKKAFSSHFQHKLPTMHNPYEGEAPSMMIVERLKAVIEGLGVKKTFQDFDFKL